MVEADMVRTGLRALTLLVLTFAGAALAQSAGPSFDLGQRTIGAVHSVTLMAHNEDCRQPLDFRFDFAPSPWLRPAGATVVRGVPTGQRRPLPAIIDLTHASAGRLVAQVDVSCENCGILLFRNCHFDRRHLTITVEAIAPAPIVEPTRRAPVSAPRVRPSAAPPIETPAPQETAPDQTEQTTVMASSAADESARACADNLGAWQLAAGLAGLTALGAMLAFASSIGHARAASHAAKALGAPSLSSRSKIAAKAREVFRAGQGGGAQDALGDALDKAREKALDRAIDECKERAERGREELVSLMQAQHQAMRALSALALADHRQKGIAAQAEGWTKIADGAQRVAGKAVKAPVDTKLFQAMQSAHGGQQTHQTLFASLETVGGNDSARLKWLRDQGFAGDDESAKGVLREMSSYAAQGLNMSDINTRLQRQAEECRRREAELAIMEALGSAQ